MPHLIIEYSANVATTVDVGALVDTMHEVALATGVAALDALRTRAVGRDLYAIADRHPDNAFVAVTIRLGAGRTSSQKRAVVAALMDALDDALADVRDTVMLSVECQEIDTDLRMNRNHLRPRVAARN